MAREGVAARATFGVGSTAELEAGSAGLRFARAARTGRIFVNGVEVAHPNDFKQHDEGFVREVDLIPGTNTLDVELSGKKGTFITIDLCGQVVDETPPRLELAAPRTAPAWPRCARTSLGVDALACPVCQGRMRLAAVIKDPARITRDLASIGEPTELPARSPSRGPPYWKSRVLRRKALGDDDA